MRVKWYFVDLIHIFLITNDAKHILMCLPIILKSSLEKCLFKTFVHFTFTWIICLCCVELCYLYVLDTRLLSDVCFANIFSTPVPHPLILLLLPFAKQKVFNFNEIQPLRGFFRGLCLWCCN